MQAPTRHESQILLTKSATTTPIPSIPINVHGQSNNAGTLQMPPTKQSYNQAHTTKRGYQRKKGDAKDNLWCDFCQRYRHTRETCRKIHGRPMIGQSHIVSHGGSWQHHQNPPSTSTNTSTVNFQHHHQPHFNLQRHCHPQPSAEKNEMEALKARLKKLEDLLSTSSSIIGSTSVANSGKDFILDKIFTIIDNVPNIDPRKTWILDYGSTDHMTPMMDFFTSYNPCPNNRKVQTADGTLLTVLGIGVISLEPIGKLEHVLHVPKLFISLISVQKVASLYPYKIEFDGLNVFLCNKVQRWKTGLAEVRQGLYYLSTHRHPQAIVREAGDAGPDAKPISHRDTRDELGMGLP